MGGVMGGLPYIGGPSPSLGQTALGLQITATTETTVLQFTPGSDIALLLRASLAIVTSATTVSLVASWTDPHAGAQTYQWENSASLPVGVRLELPLLVHAKGGQEVSIKVTAGTADQTYVTASIERVV